MRSASVISLALLSALAYAQSTNITTQINMDLNSPPDDMDMMYS